MKIAAQDSMAPGKTVLEKVERLKDYGFEGVEFWGRGLLENHQEVKKALDKVDIAAAAICAGYRGCPLDADRAQREMAMSDCKTLLSIAGDIGAVGLIFVPVFGAPRINDLSPLHTAVELEKMLLVRLLEELGEQAREAGAVMLVEPLNRYETHLLNRLEQGVGICQRVKSPEVRIMADFFHMSIEEANISASIRAAGEEIFHVHLADSNRLLPGYGHTDFRAGFATLAEIGFDKYMSLECGVPGKAEVDLPKCVEYLKSCYPGGRG